MSARDELFRRVAGAFVDESKANALIDAFADEARAGQATELDRLRAEIKQLDRTLDEVMAERDSAHDALDRMALAVAPEDVIGEHSSGNNPWANALELITPAAEVDRLRAELAAQEQVVEYGIRIHPGKGDSWVLSPTKDRADCEARLSRYQDSWPTAQMVQRPCGTWTEVQS